MSHIIHDLDTSYKRVFVNQHYFGTLQTPKLTGEQYELSKSPKRQSIMCLEQKPYDVCDYYRPGEGSNNCCWFLYLVRSLYISHYYTPISNVIKVQQVHLIVLMAVRLAL
jgi:hypothetical protein